jgi:SAM-dependent methyltransferase
MSRNWRSLDPSHWFLNDLIHKRRVERSEYDRLDRVEDRMWWFAAMHRNLLILAHRTPLAAANLPILDAGCGTGGLLVRLAGDYPESTILGLELDPQACRRAARKSSRPVCAGSVNDLPFADSALAAIFSGDVLCHQAVDEGRALRQFHRCLAEQGWLVLNLPAYRWMLSRHDAAVHNIRRYTAKSLRRLLHESGFRPVYVSYWNALLFPLMMLTRKLSPGDDGGSSDVKFYPRPMEVFCRIATGLESAWLRAGMGFPFGGSVLAIATKRDVPHG